MSSVSLAFGVKGARFGRLVATMVAVGAALFLSASFANAAQAAPALDVTFERSPSGLVAGGDASYQIAVRNVGDGSVATDSLTVTATLPPQLAAVSAGDDFEFLDIYNCSVSVDRRTVTCTGPSFLSIPPNGEACAAELGAPCRIVIEAKADPDVAVGSMLVSEVEACGTGIGCDVATTTARVTTFGEFFGIAPINGPGEPAAPALPTRTAFWAGTCDRGLAPPFGEPIVGGFGARPTTILAPSGSGGNFAQTEVPAPAVAPHCVDWGSAAPYRNAEGTLWNRPPSWRLPADAKAGGHPDGTAYFMYRRNYLNAVDGALDNAVVDLPAGFVGDPTAVPKCSAERFAVRPLRCPPETQVGMIHLYTVAPLAGTSANLGPAEEEVLPVYNIEPRKGNVAELGFAYASVEDATSVRIVARARTNGDFGVRTFVAQVPAALPLIAQSITLWGVPWDATNDMWRAPSGTGKIPAEGLDGSAPQRTPVSYDPSWGPVRPFVWNMTECDGRDPVTRLATDSYQRQGAFTPEGDPDPADPDWKRYESPAPPMTGCDKLPFDPRIDMRPTSAAADSASGLDVDVDVPQNDQPPAAVATNPVAATEHWRSDAGVATSQLDKTVVQLPEGMSVNPSAAAGLEACSDDQIGVRRVGNPYLFDNREPTCPDGSRIGTVEATTPLLEGSPNLTGEVILGAPKSTDPASGEMLRLFLVLRNEERGLLAKVYGSSVADPATGRLTATFDKNPRVPVENITVKLKGGDRGMLAMPPRCNSRAGQYRSVSSFLPWSQSHLASASQRPSVVAQDWTVDGDCGFGFAPGLRAGMSNAGGGEHGSFSFELTRRQGDQWVSGLTARLPKGLLTSVRDFPLCSDAQADAGNCPPASRIGMVDASAGSGDPLVLEQKGDVYLTEGYKGGPYGLMVKIRAIAGPFRGAMELSPIVVRQKIEVDPATAQVSAISDPFPTIWHGVPLRVRRVLVNVDRPSFMLNPSNCSPKQVQATLISTDGARAETASPFQASGCAAMPFKPRLALRLTGRKQVRTGKHPGVRAVVRQTGIGEAGIEKAVVRLPKSLALDVNNARALCEFADGTKPDLESHCPTKSIVGRARAKTPLLDRDLVGNVYFVKNVRIDPLTGKPRRTLPMIVVALRGEIAINLVGESSTTKSGKLVNTFADVPDAPITRFNLNIRGGKSGILAVTRTRRARINLCAGPRRHIAEADMDGHNGRRFDRDVRMKTPCRKAQKGDEAKSGSRHARPARRVTRDAEGR
ncbi:MAG TPA: hypothetical protein VHF90_07755 [Thermoleophilaceae bacterium]|nr:hypothetical protein [Thermoleophilaceae bacterium]